MFVHLALHLSWTPVGVPARAIFGRVPVAEVTAALA